MMLSPRSGGVILLVLSLLHLTFCSSATSSTPFSWADCGVQLNKAIHYQSASISPQAADENARLSVNVQATISDIVYDADTHLMVWKDGDLFLDVYIDDLCDIIGSTKALTCPLNPGVTSFTYEFDSVPALPSGQYLIEIKSEIGAFGSSDTAEIGCIAFTGEVDGVSAANNDCTYTSSFNVHLSGSATYTHAQRDQRVEGDSIQIGPIIGSADTQPYGQFVGDYIGTTDVGGTISTYGYNWALNGTLMSHNPDNETQRIIDIYYGTFYVLYNSVVYFSGVFNWTFDYDPSRTTDMEQVSGQMWFDPEYYVLDDDQWTWPVVIGNLGPFSVKSQNDGTFLVQGSHDFCTCGLDACGKCGGDGRSCGLGVVHHNDSGWGVRKRAAVACGVVAGILIVLVIDLSRRVRRARRRIPIHDEDLVDHPEKPDYGTMAIDDAIREGERVV